VDGEDLASLLKRIGHLPFYDPALGWIVETRPRRRLVRFGDVRPIALGEWNRKGVRTMKRSLRHGVLVLGAFGLAASGCKKEATLQTSPSAAPAAVAAAPSVQACALISAAEMGAIFGKTLVATGSGPGCQYGLDPAEKEKQMRAMTGGAGQSGSGADSANLGALANSMAKGGGFKMPSAISDQLQVDLSLSHDSQSEAQVKGIYSGMGKTVRLAVEPEKHGLNGTIDVGKDISGVADWAFATNVASVNIGPGFSTRGRILEARQGVWRVTIGATIAPDPGEAKLDGELGEVARAAFARLKDEGTAK
jgi:hypothetical protein